MDNLKFSPSDQTKPPRSLTERLAEANDHVQIEAASFMAERFAPELAPLVVNDEGLGASTAPPLQEATVGPMFAIPRERAPWATRMLLTSCSSSRSSQALPSPCFIGGVPSTS